MGFGPGIVLYQEIKSPHSLYQADHLVWEYLPLFQAQQCSFVSPKHVYPWPLSTPTAFSIAHYTGEESEFFQ